VRGRRLSLIAKSLSHSPTMESEPLDRIVGFSYKWLPEGAAPSSDEENRHARNRFKTTKVPMLSQFFLLRDETILSQFLEEFEEAFVGRLVGGKAQLARLGHVRHDFKRTP
jgi:hypothetical protein